MTPEIDLTDLAVLTDPFSAYDRAREQGAVAKLVIPGFGPFWALTRYAEARAMLADPRFEVRSESFMRPPGIPEHCLEYMRTMAEQDGPEHLRLRRLVAPAFTPKRAAQLRPRLAAITERLLDALPAHAEDGVVDLVAHFARPLPMDVICELAGIPEADRPRWREYGAAVASGVGPDFAAAIPAIIEGAKEAVARSRAEPGDDLIGDLVRAQDDDRLTDTELVTLVWHLVLAGQTPVNLVANAVEALLRHPDQLKLLRADPRLWPGAVDELMRFCSPQLLTTPRFAREDVEVDGEVIRAGERVTAAMVAADRDPRAFDGADRLDVTRKGPAQLGFSHGPHFCLGASIARVETEVALSLLFDRYPDLALAGDVPRAPDGGTWRPAKLPLTL
ncbi:cytochrome P450 [Amycolatopsis sp. SID8362]|uniref:cytochrome P450 family protein n=1 Tax=Amycolatopsis sp. SID8362 TaxID=2690346 RepID=UPI00137158C5|nr:cytochrome P450 [Amycolatopsis sp. SID8362]NBH04964.1 cytochrome P450 [Amycolatopsis sp. SID8362]NED41664.1 cytochrome P450 [Amycolatopsis sp. SID8362]